MFKKRVIFTKLVTAALAVTTSSFAAAQTQTDLHRDAATHNTFGDPFMLQYARAFYCNLPDDNNGIVIQARSWNNTTGANNNQYRIPLTQILDDVWTIGNHYVTQYMIKMPDGIVEVDSGNTPMEFATFNYPALQTLGLSATYPLKAIFLTHGHGDHDGGAQWALDNLGARSYLGSADNTLGAPAGKSYKPILIDSTDLSMRTMSIGGKTFWILPTPGHTPGSTSAVLEATDHGQTVRVLINGGQSMTNSIPEVAQYLDSIERVYAMASALNVDGVMTPHIYWDGEGFYDDQINATGRTNPSQNVYGHETVMHMTAVARECSAAWLTELDATRVLPVWRANKIDLMPVSPGPGAPLKVSAKLSNGWGPVANQSVAFSVDGQACTAVTNAAGVATCGKAFSGVGSAPKVISASYAGAQSSDFVDLPTDKTQTITCANQVPRSPGGTAAAACN